MEIAFIAFSEKGLNLAQNLAEKQELQSFNTYVTCGFNEENEQDEERIKSWTQHQFETAPSDVLVFVGTTDLAVRTIAPLLNNVYYNPAVIVLDENGNNCIPLLSGHVENATEIAHTLAELCKAHFANTEQTATVFEIDKWAHAQDLLIPDTTGVSLITSTLEEGKEVECAEAVFIKGEAPAGVTVIPIHNAFDESENPRFHVGCRVDAVADLDVIVPAAVLTINCRKGVTVERIEESAALFLEQSGIHPAALCSVAGLDSSDEEETLKQFAQGRNLPFTTMQEEGLELTEKTVVNGITFGIILRDTSLTWEY